MLHGEYRMNCNIITLPSSLWQIHGDFAQQMINRYGLLSCPPDSSTVEDFGLQNASCISKLIPQLARGEHEATKFQVLLRSLQYLSKLDGSPLFVWWPRPLVLVLIPLSYLVYRGQSWPSLTINGSFRWHQISVKKVPNDTLEWVKFYHFTCGICLRNFSLACNFQWSYNSRNMAKIFSYTGLFI